MITVGVLGLQGAFARHEAVLTRLKVSTRIVRYREDLRVCDGLVIPGGESTTITKLVDFSGMREALLKFAETKPVMGTCAGMIMMARKAGDPRVHSLNLLDIEVERNAYGRQVDSFVDRLKVSLNGKPCSLEGIFIRAPKIRSIGENVTVLATLNNEPVFVQQGHHLATAFHPELSNSTLIHEYFLSLVKEPILVH